MQIINLSLSGVLVCLFVLVGYAAVDLQPCDKSRRVFTNSWGVITDGPVDSNYTQDSHCEWLIKANGTNKFITLSFRSMGTECSYDYVFVYDGGSFKSPLLGSFSGKTEPQQVIAKSGYMLILLYSDTNYVLDGFRAEFSITDCPNNCSDNGFCNKNHCICGNEWGGFDCSKRLCPNNCGKSEGHGECISGKCVCHEGYSGQSCSLYKFDIEGNKWHWLSYSENGLTPRAAHSAVYVEATDALYIFGGYNLNEILGQLEVYNFKNSTWTDEYGQELPGRSLVKKVEPGAIARLMKSADPKWQDNWGISRRKSFFNSLLFLNENNTIRRRQRHSQKPEMLKPLPRFGHAACEINNGFLIFGGKLDNGSLSNELWLFNVHIKKWELRAELSDSRPPPLTRHTLTRVGDIIYLFGGGTSDGEFSSRLYSIILKADGTEQWQKVRARGGKELDVRVVAHTSVYHSATNSLLVYGGIVAGVARFSKLSDRMYAFQLDQRHWTEIHYTREILRDRYVPRERAFHTANILGNYLVVFGGYSHRHNKEEICYDNQMYLYHLGCHVWVNPEILGKTNDSIYPKQQGVFAHASSVRKGNTLILAGGYHGNINGDLLAYTVPPMIAVRTGDHYDPESTCGRHKNYAECSADPECGWCSADAICYGRTVGANCTTNLQTTRCLGVCPALLDCKSCLIHGLPHTDSKPFISAAYKLGLAECTWCVQNARCNHKDDNFGFCGLREDSSKRMHGWWGAKGTEVVKPEQCRELDQRPGLTYIKYFPPVNLTQPDIVDIINATSADMTAPNTPLLRNESPNGTMVGRLLGFLRPPVEWEEELSVCVSYCNATLKIGEDNVSTFNAQQKDCYSMTWPEKEKSNRVPIDFMAYKTVNIGAYNAHHVVSTMQLKHKENEREPAKVFRFEYLEPYSNGSCSQYSNCQYCLTDSLCGWCDLTNSCVSRLDTENVSCSVDGDWRYLTSQPSDCSNCSNFISCESCTETGLCEWWIEEARCARIGTSNEATRNVKKCPMPCYKRPDCSSCLQQKGRCVWCEATQQCFSFSVYTSEYQFGMCREWLDQAFPVVTNQENNFLQNTKTQEQCKSCSHYTNCTTCLSSLSCGWCYNSSNPITGICVQGDFNEPHVSCSNALNIPNARWAYAQCPDVDECGLGLHDCHPEAICTNTDGSFSCHCKRGFNGDGRASCTRTCYNICVHGTCQGEPDYLCKCDLGWTGDDCSINCGCNNHSDCPNGVGICDNCQNWTEGEFCELCKIGSYGNATTKQGCKKCECNGHGDKSKGECDIVTGVCYCQDNTEGDKCERCKQNYYGDPSNGKQCYYHCEARGVLKGSEGQGISSRQSYNQPREQPPKECLWIINPTVEYGTPIIQLQMNASDLNVTCGENAVYVYDGLPELADMGSQNALSAVFCSEEALPTTLVESRTGHLTVHYKQGSSGEGFSAMYNVIQCENCEFPRRCKNGQCVCDEGRVGPECEEVICPDDCHTNEGHGTCDHSYGRCLCNTYWAGPACDTSLNGTNKLVFTELFNTDRLTDNLEHLRKTLPRFGHSLSSDRRGSLWMFGGYSLSHGPLNDIRLFDTRNSTWMQVTVDSTPDAKMPRGRYFHGADIVHSKQAIYVFGGITKTKKSANNRTLDDFWQFDIQNQRWGEIEKGGVWPPPLFGHTLTYYRNASSETVILIGGVSPQDGFLNTVWEYALDKEAWYFWESKGNGPLGIFGHSTVFYPVTNSLYVFGGFILQKQRSILSNKLYVLNHDTRTWTDLSLISHPDNLPRGRYLHSAVTTDTHMIVYGGRIYPWSINETLYAYSYNCNQWINFMSSGIVKVGDLPTQTYAQAMTIEPDGDAVYIVGGWGTDTQCSVLQIKLPLDLCSLWLNRSCINVPECQYCALEYQNSTTLESCYSVTKQCPLDDIVNVKKHLNRGRSCNGPFHQSDCSEIKHCTTCTQTPECQWCDGMCLKNKTCSGLSYTSLEQCPLNECRATDCIQCYQIQAPCDWDNTTQQCYLSKRSSYDISFCRAPCSHFTNCSSCLENYKGFCRWSTQLGECISESYQPIYCAGGVCGLVLDKKDEHKCPEPCSSFKQCSTCLARSHCGWCAAPGQMGSGACVDSAKKSCDKLFEDDSSTEAQTLDRNVTYSWHYVKCPPENECANNHHHCDPISEVCVDEEKGFDCICGRGYNKSSNYACLPVCTQGCVWGKCVEPDNCVCDFGYVGANCSIPCQCNGHANCAGPDKLDKCLDCQNNTMGSQCDKCKPYFVGNPKDGGKCIPCNEYCNGHSSICVPKHLKDSDVPMDLNDLKEGPVEEARCIGCSNLTAGDRCEDCIIGNFRPPGGNYTDKCRACECHGHGDTCNQKTGEQCNCQNNTESEPCSSGSKNTLQPCWMLQCSKCKDGYYGTPKDGQQCYKQLSSQMRLCFDAKQADDCKIKPKPLNPGEMMFLYIQPRFMNVDIRVIIDVTQGELNVFMSTLDSTFKVRLNNSSGINDIDFDTQYKQWENSSKNIDNNVLEKEAIGLRTYITIEKPKPILRIKGLKDRLVIILPQEHHNLEQTRFYIVLQALEPEDKKEKAAYGIIFFQQDQLHIDLFVFFSVFFSCFFLFLAACVVAWKAKQAADVRRARRRQVNEMLHMAKRPFARVTLNLGPRPRVRPWLPNDVRPVAVEPTGDGLAAVITVFISFPGGHNPSVRLALASSLILHDKQINTGGRAFLRRRSAHAAPPI